MDSVPDIMDNRPTPVDELLEQERLQTAIRALEKLPDKEIRPATYACVCGYTIDEIATYLGLRSSNVRGRLHRARKRLLQGRKPEDVTANPEKRRVINEVIIRAAAASGNLASVANLLEEDPSLLLVRDWWGLTPLGKSIENKRWHVAKFLITKGALWDLEAACLEGSIDMVKRLARDRGFGVNAHLPSGLTPLILAATGGSDRLVNLLLDMGAHPDVPDSRDISGAPLHWALFKRNTKAAAALLRRGANPNQRRGHTLDRAGWTPLHYAVRYDLPDLITPLLHLGASPDVKDDFGLTPLDTAYANQCAASSLLLANSALARQSITVPPELARPRE